MGKIYDHLDVLVRRKSMTIRVKESLPLKFLAVKSRQSSIKIIGRASAFGVSRLVLFGSQDGDSTIITASSMAA